MSVIIRLQNLPWSANALDIRTYFRGLSIPEGGVHIVGGELGDAFIAFSTDEDARQAMMLDGGKIKEIQVKLLLSSRSEMHKVIEAARQSVPILTLTAPAAAPTPAPAPSAPLPATIPPPVTVTPTITPFSTALGSNPLGFGIPGIGNPQEIPQPAVIEVPNLNASPPIITTPNEPEKDEEKIDKQRKERDRRRSRSRSRDRKDRKRDRRDRSRSREKRRRDRSRSRERRERKRDRRSRSRDRSPSRRSRDRRNPDRKSPNSQEKTELPAIDTPLPAAPVFNSINPNYPLQFQEMPKNPLIQNGPAPQQDIPQNRFNDPTINDTLSKLQELGKKRNPNAFQGDQNGDRGGRFVQGGRGGMVRGGGNIRREGRTSRFDEPQRDCCVAIRNAPNHTSYGDVRRFFPFMIDKHGIKMINDGTGRRTGNIFVRFCETRSKQIALQRKHNELKGEQVVVEDLDDEIYETAVDSFLPFREDNDDEDPSIAITDTEVKSQSPFNVLKLSEMPNFIKEQDIIKAFSDFSLLSITLNDCRMTRTKIAFVQFVNSDDARAAYEKKDRYLFGKRQAIVTPVTNTEFENTKKTEDSIELIPNLPIDQPQEPSGPRDPRQRRQNFESASVAGASPRANTQMQIQPPQGAPFFGPPFAQQPGFPPQFPASQFPTFPGPQGPGPLDPRSVPMDPRGSASNMSFQQGFPNLPLPVNMPKQNPAIIEIDEEPLDCVLMKGLPRGATDRTIVNFLSDTGAVPARIHLMLDQNGLPSGDCFCEFRSPQEASRAATKHGFNLEGCRITVDLVSRSVVEDALEGPKPLEIRETLPRNSPTLNLPPQPLFDNNSSVGGFGSRGSFRGRGSFDRGSFNDRSGYGRGSFEQGRNSYRGRGSWNDRGGRGGFERSFERGRGRGFGRGRVGFENGRGGFENDREPRMEQRMDPRNKIDDEQDPALEDFGAPGCVVSMENVPFRATVDDILNFFSEFELSQDDVIRRFNERGQPTGDARVAFRTPFDAQRSVKTRHMDMIHDRRISLTVL